MIEVRGLRKTFADGTVALHSVDLDVDPGLFGLLGPNGAGKTTLMSILVLALEPSGGSLRYHGLDPADPACRRRLRGRLGFLPQNFEPLAQLSGREYLAYCLRLRQPEVSRREAARRVEQQLAAVDLTGAGHRIATTYSGGMRRRLGLAQALIHEPDLLVIDEPTAGLDPEERIRFRNLIVDVGLSTTVILSTHIVEDIEATCSRIAVVARGRVLFAGEAVELLRRLTGRLWSVDARAGLPAGAVSVGERAGEDGAPLRLFVAAEAMPGARACEPNLETAYLAFLATQAAAGTRPAGDLSDPLCV